MGKEPRFFDLLPEKENLTSVFSLWTLSFPSDSSGNVQEQGPEKRREEAPLHPLTLG